MSSIISELFVEKFRPQKIEQLIAVPRVKDQLKDGLNQNLLLYGSAGTGKTSSAWILAKGHPTLFLNASEERGIDIIRDRIIPFCSTMSLEDGMERLKCVILDELDGATTDFFGAFRPIMEKFSKNVRFIASCNTVQKVPNPVGGSRFLPIAYDPITKEEEIYLKGEYKKRIGAILKAVKISYTEEIIDKFIHNDFPDLRALMNKVQSLHIRGIGELTLDNIVTTSDFKDLFQLCLNKPEKPYENYKVIVDQFGSKVDESLMALGNDFPEFLKNAAPEKLDKLPGVLISLAEYQYQKAFCVDPLITLLAAVLRIQQILNN
jgi:DNA polymerase III delta prime subunit